MATIVFVSAGLGWGGVGWAVLFLRYSLAVNKNNERKL